MGVTHKAIQPGKPLFGNGEHLTTEGQYQWTWPWHHSAILLTSGGQIEVTKWAKWSNCTNPGTLKYKEIKEIYQTNCVINGINVIYIQSIDPNGSFCNFNLSTTRHCEYSFIDFLLTCNISSICSNLWIMSFWQVFLKGCKGVLKYCINYFGNLLAFLTTCIKEMTNICANANEFLHFAIDCPVKGLKLECKGLWKCPMIP